MRKFFFDVTLVGIFCVIWVNTAMAQEVDDILGGFDDFAVEAPETVAPEAEQKPFELAGALTLGTAYNYAHNAPDEGKTDYRGLSRLRVELELDLDIIFSQKWKAFVSGRGFYDGAYEVNGREGYTDEVLDTYEKESEFRDVYILGTITENLDVKIGQQIIVWGKSDNARVTDILNPLDNREPGMVDIEDLRLPVTATRLDYYLGQWSLTAAIIHEIRFNKNPAFGSDFYPFDSPRPNEEIPDSNSENWEYALALNGIFAGWDISFYYAKVWDDNPYASVTGTPGEADRMVTLKHSRLNMYGVATNLAIKSWLIKAEGAYFDRLRYSSLPGETKGRYDILAGVEYSGFNETTLSVEVVNRHIAGYEQRMGDGSESTSEDQFQSYFRYSEDFYNSRLHLLFLVSLLDVDGSEGAFGRFHAKYDLMDALSITGGVIMYESGDNRFFDKIGDNDRVFIDLKRSF